MKVEGSLHLVAVRGRSDQLMFGPIAYAVGGSYIFSLTMTAPYIGYSKAELITLQTNKMNNGEG